MMVIAEMLQFCSLFPNKMVEVTWLLQSVLWDWHFWFLGKHFLWNTRNDQSVCCVWFGLVFAKLLFHDLAKTIVDRMCAGLV